MYVFLHLFKSSSLCRHYIPVFVVYCRISMCHPLTLYWSLFSVLFSLSFAFLFSMSRTDRDYLFSVVDISRKPSPPSLLHHFFLTLPFNLPLLLPYSTHHSPSHSPLTPLSLSFSLFPYCLFPFSLSHSLHTRFSSFFYSLFLSIAPS